MKFNSIAKNMTEIKKVNAKDWEIVWTIVEKVIPWMESQGFKHWSEYYTPEVIKEKFKTSDVFVIFVDDKPVGTGSISKEFPDYYSQVDKEAFSSQSKIGSLTTLAVIPEEQGKGYAKDLIKYIEDYAKQSSDYNLLTFDARASYMKLIKFHLKNGYKIVGVMDDEGEDYFLFEKEVH